MEEKINYRILRPPRVIEEGTLTWMDFRVRCAQVAKELGLKTDNYVFNDSLGKFQLVSHSLPDGLNEDLVGNKYRLAPDGRNYIKLQPSVF